ncbi:hypothetical protein [Nitratireductor indicus]|uniref:hypothetical protein n=1 Tax=Nitratireductor indicus TaxID=721133 RepID=UPI002874229D|nr:hypothetical protein [Nitratireductor indicus]MDS1136282.1 hypothetical protein [Nitratireductor indicus]
MPVSDRTSETRPQRDAAGWLGLAASPTFALMAWISAGDDMMCASGSGLLSVGGMAWMYLLMGLFHLAPWLRLASVALRQGAALTSQIKGD